MDGQSVQTRLGWLLLLGLVLLVACASEEEEKRKACERYRDHIVELRLADAPNAKVAAEHRDLIKQSLGEELVSSCEADMTSDQIRCAMAASDSADVLSCGTASE